MIAHYYSQRQLSPLRGMVHVVDVGHALAYTLDGVQWRARLRSREGRLWPVGGWLDAARMFEPVHSAALMDAVNARPPLPFPQADRVELWLLSRATRRPLALLQTRRNAAGTEAPKGAVWSPFPAGENDFQAECLRGYDRASPLAHREVLARQVNAAAEPDPLVQWFVRGADGTGRGLDDRHLPKALRGRTLAREAFPELLVDERWGREIERALVREFHDWHAAALLTHLDLTRAMRARLEAAACRRPEKLLEVYGLIPEFIDRRRLEVGLVQARLMLTAAPAGA